MSFLGPVTTLDGHLVRPHDLEIETHPFDDAYPGRIERFNRVGFEVRLDVRLTEVDNAPPVLVTLTRAEATAKALELGLPVWITPVENACPGRPGLGAATHICVGCCLTPRRLEIVVPARVVVVLLVALFYPLECALGLLARLVRTEPVGDLGVVVVWYDLMGFEVKPPIAVRHLTLLRAAASSRLLSRSPPTLAAEATPQRTAAFDPSP